MLVQCQKYARQTCSKYARWNRKTGFFCHHHLVTLAGHQNMWALLPVKDLNLGKSRLADSLSVIDRHTLMAAMLSDLLNTLRQCHSIHNTVVVTRCPDAAAIATELGAVVLSLPQDTGLNEAVTAGITTLTQQGVQQAMVLHADLPAVTPEDIQAAIAAHAAYDLTLVPDTQRNGTNLLLLNLPSRLPFCYGNNSYTAHRQAAAQHGLRYQTFEHPRLGMDLDLWEDMQQLRQIHPDTLPEQLRAWLACHPDLIRSTQPIASP